jgi:putative aldouronate transport system permease protein
MLYLSDRDKFPLQLILREILLQNISSGNVEGPAADQQIVGESIRYALIIVATVPILLVYPFIQKYFVKGVLVGAIKG